MVNRPDAPEILLISSTPKFEVVRARYSDSTGIRELFGRELRAGELVYDSWCPYYDRIVGDNGLPYFEVWVVHHLDRVVGAGWYEVTDPGQIRIVVLTDTRFPELTKSLLMQVEGVILALYDGINHSVEDVRAWVPESPLRMEMEIIYESRGWAPSTQWWVDLTKVQTRRRELIISVNAARRKGIYVLPYDPDVDFLPEHPFLDVMSLNSDEILIAHWNGHPIAANGVYVDPCERKIVFVEPVVYGRCDDLQAVTDALTASLLLTAMDGPQLLVDSRPLNRYELWFTNFKPTRITQYRLRKETCRSIILLPYP